MNSTIRLQTIPEMINELGPNFFAHFVIQITIVFKVLLKRDSVPFYCNYISIGMMYFVKYCFFVQVMIYKIYHNIFHLAFDALNMTNDVFESCDVKVLMKYMIDNLPSRLVASWIFITLLNESIAICLKVDKCSYCDICVSEFCIHRYKIGFWYRQGHLRIASQLLAVAIIFFEASLYILLYPIESAADSLC